MQARMIYLPVFQEKPEVYIFMGNTDFQGLLLIFLKDVEQLQFPESMD